jgi:hypothetical protein
MSHVVGRGRYARETYPQSPAIGLGVSGPSGPTGPFLSGVTGPTGNTGPTGPAGNGNSGFFVTSTGVLLSLAGTPQFNTIFGSVTLTPAKTGQFRFWIYATLNEESVPSSAQIGVQTGLGFASNTIFASPFMPTVGFICQCFVATGFPLGVPVTFNFGGSSSGPQVSVPPGATMIVEEIG